MKTKRKMKKRYRAFHLMLLIPLLFLVVYSYIPMGGVVIAFQDFVPIRGFLKSEWVGLENFITVYENPYFLRALGNTVIVSFWKIIFSQLVPVVFSILLNEVRHSGRKRVAQTIVYMPYFVSWVLMSGIIIEIFSPSGGVINNILGLFGIKPIFFLGSNKWFRPLLVATDVWKNFGWGTIIYMAALSGIDVNQYEAAMLDGAGRWKQTLYITLPGIAPTFVMMLTLSFGDILNAGFDQVFNLMSDVTMESGDILDTLVYRLGMKQAQYSVATAVGLFKSLVGTAFMLIAYKLAYKITGYRAF